MRYQAVGERRDLLCVTEGLAPTLRAAWIPVIWN